MSSIQSAVSQKPKNKSKKKGNKGPHLSTQGVSSVANSSSAMAASSAVKKLNPKNIAPFLLTPKSTSKSGNTTHVSSNDDIIKLGALRIFKDMIKNILGVQNYTNHWKKMIINTTYLSKIYDSKKNLKDMMRETLSQTFNLSNVNYPGENIPIPRVNHGSGNWFRQLLFGYINIETFMFLSPNIFYEIITLDNMDNHLGDLTEDDIKKRLFALVMSSHFQSAGRINENSDEINQVYNIEAYKNMMDNNMELHSDLQKNNLSQDNGKVKTYTLYGSILYKIFMNNILNHDGTDKKIESFINYCAYGGIYYLANNIDEYDHSLTHRFLLLNSFIVSGHYFDHCRAGWSKFLENAHSIFYMNTLFNPKNINYSSNTLKNFTFGKCVIKINYKLYNLQDSITIFKHFMQSIVTAILKKTGEYMDDKLECKTSESLGFGSKFIGGIFNYSADVIEVVKSVHTNFDNLFDTIFQFNDSSEQSHKITELKVDSYVKEQFNNITYNIKYNNILTLFKIIKQKPFKPIKQHKDFNYNDCLDMLRERINNITRSVYMQLRNFINVNNLSIGESIGIFNITPNKLVFHKDYLDKEYLINNFKYKLQHNYDILYYIDNEVNINNIYTTDNIELFKNAILSSLLYRNSYNYNILFLEFILLQFGLIFKVDDTKYFSILKNYRPQNQNAYISQFKKCIEIKKEQYNNIQDNNIKYRITASIKLTPIDPSFYQGATEFSLILFELYLVIYPTPDKIEYITFCDYKYLNIDFQLHLIGLQLQYYPFSLSISEIMKYYNNLFQNKLLSHIYSSQIGKKLNPALQQILDTNLPHINIDPGFVNSVKDTPFTMLKELTDNFESNLASNLVSNYGNDTSDQFKQIVSTHNDKCKYINIHISNYTGNESGNYSSQLLTYHITGANINAYGNNNWYYNFNYLYNFISNKFDMTIINNRYKYEQNDYYYVFRAFSLISIDGALNIHNLDIGTTFKNICISSASLNPLASINFLSRSGDTCCFFIIKAHIDSKLINISKLSNFPFEYEVLLPFGCQLKIINKYYKYISPIPYDKLYPINLIKRILIIEVEYIDPDFNAIEDMFSFNDNTKNYIIDNSKYKKYFYDSGPLGFVDLYATCCSNLLQIGGKDPNVPLKQISSQRKLITSVSNNRNNASKSNKLIYINNTNSSSTSRKSIKNKRLHKSLKTLKLNTNRSKSDSKVATKSKSDSKAATRSKSDSKAATRSKSDSKAATRSKYDSKAATKSKSVSSLETDKFNKNVVDTFKVFNKGIITLVTSDEYHKILHKIIKSRSNIYKPIYELFDAFNKFIDDNSLRHIISKDISVNNIIECMFNINSYIEKNPYRFVIIDRK